MQHRVGLGLDRASLTEAARVLGAEDMREARRLARIELWSAPHCMTCRWFLLRAPAVSQDANPRELLESFDVWERDDHSLRLAASWIVLRGSR
jgi:hypothetical protein